MSGKTHAQLAACGRVAALAAALLCLCFLLPPGAGLAAEDKAEPGVEDWNRHVHERLQSRERQAEIERAKSRDTAAAEERARREAENAPPPGEPAHSLDTEFLESGGGSGGYTARAEPDTLVLGVERDVVVTVMKDGAPVESGLEVVFEAGSAYHKMRATPRKTANGGTVSLKGLLPLAEGAAPLRLSINGRTEITCPITVIPPARPLRGSAPRRAGP